MMWNFSEFSNQTALIDDKGHSLTYQQLQEENERLAKAIGRRCLIFSMCSNTIGSVIGYTGFMRNQMVPVLLGMHMDTELLRNLMDCYCPAFLWMPTEMTKGYEEFQKCHESHGYCLLKTNYPHEYALHVDLGLLLTTSGSTGSPKFVRQSYENVRVNAQQIAEYLELDTMQRPVTTLPMNYTYGCSIINSHLLVGATILLTDESLVSRDFWTFMKDQAATSFGGVPYTYEILEKLRFLRMDLPDLQYMTQAGGKLSPELHKKFAEYAIEKGKKFIVMYGACEATARMGYLPYKKSLEKYGSCGMAIPKGKFYLMDVNDQIIEEPEVTGELIYEGPNVTMGYAICGEDLCLGDVRHGVLHTGDMAKRDTDGFYYIVGRRKRFLKIYGNRVNLDEIDRMIKERFDFIECASAGVDDHLYIFITEESLVDNVQAFLSDKTKLNPRAFHVIQIHEIPKNDAGKTMYQELAKYYETSSKKKE